VIAGRSGANGKKFVALGCNVLNLKRAGVANTQVNN
jgi:hypothetical protein